MEFVSQFRKFWRAILVFSQRFMEKLAPRASFHDTNRPQITIILICASYSNSEAQLNSYDSCCRNSASYYNKKSIHCFGRCYFPKLTTNASPDHNKHPYISAENSSHMASHTTHCLLLSASAKIFFSIKCFYVPLAYPRFPSIHNIYL